jgi:predicted enzyme related to lactoylglutathione lyase
VEGNAAADQTGIPALGNDRHPSLTAQGKDGSDLGGVARPHHRGSVPLEAAGPVDNKASSRIAGQNMRSAHHCSDGAQHPGGECGLHWSTRRPGFNARLYLFLSPHKDRNAAHTGGMPLRLHHVVIDAHDLPGLARFWTQALGWKVLSEREHEIVIGTDENAPLGICFMPVTDLKTVKNRVHLDLTSSAADRDQEIDRLLALGARRVDIGQTGAESWTVLADPEGNEFCVVRPKETLIR